MIYLDYAATTPASPSSIDAWLKANTTFFANTSSLHEAGSHAEQLTDLCRKKLASFTGTEPDNVYFTSGGTESNMLALRSLYLAHKHRGSHVITSAVEHPSVHAFFSQLEQNGVDVTYVKVNKYGLINTDDVIQATRSDTFLASIQHVNSETGVIQPLAELGRWFNKQNIPFHSDCVQSFGKLPVNIQELNVDALSVSAHKVYAPKGTGAVFMKNGTKWNPSVPGTTHENGFRPGTVNTPGIAAFTQAAEDLFQTPEMKIVHGRKLRQSFLNALDPISDRLSVEGSVNDHEQSPWIVGMGIRGVQGQYLMQSLDRFQICISTGSACQSQKEDASAVMNAVYSSEQERLRFFRISFGVQTTEEELLLTAKKILEIVNYTR